ncbi:glycoside hydrolase family 3 protein [Nocardioides houyundeii]|uniref:glycoside hydrolase family 3 protein n=1 Tax=Nocardioides houyundeii TaxID=2045452 RepID=UPI000DF36B23|nr:glycoside hydrolase family 3 N-terminal domain-containing protein [Nocardioides houyundeii]
MRTRGAIAVVAAQVLLYVGAAGCSTEAQMRSGSALVTHVSAVTQGDPEPTAPRARLGLAEGWGPTADELDEAATLVGDLTLTQLAGQVLVADWSGTRPPVEMVRDLHLGGVIWFSGNITSADQVRRANRALRRADDRPWPLLVGVDQEGGLVERAGGVVTGLPSFMTGGAARRPDLTRAATAATGRELRGLGFTANFAPVADVTVGAADPTIGTRAASSDPALVAEQVLAAARGYADAGLVSTLKHFPGHGSVREDSHVTLPVQPRSLAQLQGRDLVPFRDAVAAGSSSVMVGHLDVRAVDPGVPASLSRDVVTGLLRTDLGFDGLVVTDSLAMTAVTRSYGPARAAVRALRAGADVLLMPADPVVARNGIVAAVRRGDLTRRRLEQAAARQVALLMHHRDARGAPPGSARPQALAWSRAAVTVLSRTCQGRLVGRRVQPVGDRDVVAAFTAAARSAGLRVGPRGTRVALLRSASRSVRADVAVAVGAPWVLAGSSARHLVATYGTTPGAMRALVEVLLGRRPAPGRVPVEVADVPARGC